MPTTCADGEEGFLPSRRAPKAEVDETARRLATSSLPLLFDDYPIVTFLLNRERQIVYANAAALGLVSKASQKGLIGLRVGEVLSCIHAEDAEGGCGTGPLCRFCGAARSIASSLAGETYANECVIVRKEGPWEDHLDILAWTKPIRFEGLDLIILSARDISARQDQLVLQRIFDHDIGNTVNGIQAILHFMKTGPDDPNGKYIELLRSASGQMIEELESHRLLVHADLGELALEIRPVRGGQVLGEILALFRYNLYNKGLALALDADSADPLIETDPTILRRVIANMVKNALEAGLPGETIGVACRGNGARVLFVVRNRAVMTEVEKQRVFTRSFTTKGPGRGLGTYSMRLLGERYLGGQVSFSSIEGEGTVFSLDLPLRRKTV